MNHLVIAFRTSGVLICCAIGALWASSARADLTVEALTASAGTGVGPHVQEISEAIRKFGAKDFPGAFGNLENAKKKVPVLSPPEVMMALLYYDANQAPLASAALEKAIARVPADPEPYVVLAERAVAEGRFTEAGFMFDKALELVQPFEESPKRKRDVERRALSGSISILENRRDWQAARPKLEALLKLDPKNASANERLGRALLVLGDQKAALAAFQAAAAADPAMLPAEIAMAMLLAEKDRAMADKLLARAIKNGADELRTRVAASNYYLRTNQLDEARQQAEAAVKLDPEGIDSNAALGVIARIGGDLKTAIACLSKTHLLAPNNAAIINQLALALAEMPDEPSRVRALQFAESNIRQNQSATDLMATYGWTCYRLNRRQDADRAFGAVLSAAGPAGLSNVGPELGFYLANLFKDQGRDGEALRLLKEALASPVAFAYRPAAQELATQLAKQQAKAAAAKADNAKGAATPKAPASK